MTFRRVVVVGLACVIGPAFVPVAAWAAPNPSQYVRASADIAEPQNLPNGGSARCPTGMRAIAGGAYFHEPGGAAADPNTVRLDDSTVSVDGRGWYAAGINSTGPNDLVLTVVAQCLPKAQVGSATTFTQDFAGPGGIGGTLSCPTGERVLTGGAFMHRPGQGAKRFDAAHFVSSSAPTIDDLSWYADGFSSARDPHNLTIVLRCIASRALKNASFGSVAVNFGTAQAQDYTIPCNSNNQLAFTGGAYWHVPTSGPNPANAGYTQLSATTVTGDALDWYAGGRTNNTPTTMDLTVVIGCLPI